MRPGTPEMQQYFARRGYPDAARSGTGLAVARRDIKVWCSSVHSWPDLPAGLKEEVHPNHTRPSRDV